ncbi:heparinase II/III domain-containing protein [Agrococcus sp. Marseille-P2731]|uniref:heparinase II/III domain-containing protein n=1 Tax=Agrococcus sp. Marseille-P2731 TaxID=1841862 RepID=UPI000930DE15|nr:heparinase II/III family protein [Agrococcus sp. Marseille-P2731]
MTVVEGNDRFAVEQWLPEIVDGLLSSEQGVPLHELLQATGLITEWPTAKLRQLAALLRAQGYLDRAASVGSVVAEREPERPVSGAASMAAELAVLRGDPGLRVDPLTPPYKAEPGRLLVVVGSSLPEVDSTFTRRTHALVAQAQELGARVAVATQMGFGQAAGYDIDTVDGVSYHRVPGPLRGSVMLDEWLRIATTRLAAVVRKVRPSAIIATSDFLNGMAAREVCRAYGIPFVYDVRGYWQDSWLERQRDKYGWSGEQVPARWGPPDVWRLRGEREDELVSEADFVVASTEALLERAQRSAQPGADVYLLEDPTDGAAVLAVLEHLGVMPRGGAELVRVGRSGIEAGHARALLDGSERGLGKVAAMGGGSATADDIMGEGWRDGKLPPVAITSPFDWILACRDNRSQGFRLHAWDFMVPLLESWDQDENRDALVWCLSRAADWSRTFLDGAAHGTMAWYDMAMGLRAPRLAYLLQEALLEGLADDIVQPLIDVALVHQRKLFEPAAFNPRTNHGFYTAVGQLAFAKRLHALPGMGVLTDQGTLRLREVVTTQFAADGGHLEHSPDYHRMLLSSFKDATDDGLLDDPEVGERLERAGEVLGWFIQPDRRLVQIGDSPERESSRASPGATPHTRFLSSGGAAGEPNAVELMLLPQSGYAFVRSPQPQQRGDHRSAAYLSFMGGFHSRTHKHCDDLSITWFDAGQELLIDAGRFGYLDPLPADSPLREKGFFYSRPERQYVEGTVAHNTAQADRQDHERRRRAPYGSAIKEAAAIGGAFRLSGAVDHGHWRHERRIHLVPGSSLRVEDEVRSLDGELHDFNVWWNLPGTLDDPTEPRPGVVAFRLENGGEMTVEGLSDAALESPVRGQREPLRGWRSRSDFELTPAWSFGYHVTARSEHTFVTCFSISSDASTDRAGASSATRGA